MTERHGVYYAGSFGGIKSRDGKAYSDVYLHYMGGHYRLSVRNDSPQFAELSALSRGDEVVLKVTEPKVQTWTDRQTGETRPYMGGLLVIEVTESGSPAAAAPASQ